MFVDSVAHAKVGVCVVRVWIFEPFIKGKTWLTGQPKLTTFRIGSLPMQPFYARLS